MKEEFKKGLILSVISFSKSLKLDIDEEENYIAKGDNFELNTTEENSLFKLFSYIYNNELGKEFSPNCDDDYYLAFIEIVKNNIDNINYKNLIKNSVILDAIHSSEEKGLVIASTLILAMLEDIPNSSDKIKNIMTEI